MEEREHPSFGTLVAEVSKPMLLALVVAFFLSPPGLGLLLIAVLVIAAICSGPVFILTVVRSVNRHDDQGRMRSPEPT